MRLTVARDGSFVLDVSNDPGWLKLRLESIPGPFIDRVVLFVDGREIRPSSVERLPASTDSPGALDTYRMRGQLPLGAHTLRWFYGLVIDAYPLTIIHADGHISVQEVQGNAWSGAIDLNGQLSAPRVGVGIVGLAATALLLFPLGFQLAGRRSTTEGAVGPEGNSCRVQD